MTRLQKASISLLTALVLLGINVVFHQRDSIPRSEWLYGYALILSMLGFAGGAIGALFGRYWTGFLLGIVLPFVAFIAFAGGFPC